MKHCSKLKKGDCVTYNECIWVNSLGCRKSKDHSHWIKKCTKVCKKECTGPECKWIKNIACKKFNLQTIFMQIASLTKDKRNRLISSFSEFLRRKRNLTLLDSISNADVFFTSLEEESKNFLESLKHLNTAERNTLSKETLNEYRNNQDCTLIKIISWIDCMDIKKPTGVKIYTKVFVDCVQFLWNTKLTGNQLKELEFEAVQLYREVPSDSDEKTFSDILASSV